MSLKLSTYLNDLRKKALYYSRVDINGKMHESFFDKYLSRIICLVISIGTLLFLKGGFNSDFISYASSMLSIFVGLFITALIFSFDKFYKTEGSEKIENSEDLLNSKQAVWEKQAFNYSKQFGYIVGYNIILCIFTLILLSLSFLFNDLMSVDFNEYSLTTKLTYDTLMNFGKLVIVGLQRFFVIFWILLIMYNTLFVVSSMVKFMMVKLDRLK